MVCLQSPATLAGFAGGGDEWKRCATFLILRGFKKSIVTMPSNDQINPNTRMKLLITILSTMTVALSASFAETPASATSSQHPKTKTEEFFKKLDTDSDGALSAEEFKTGLSAKTNSAAVEEYFNKLDTNGDGNVSLAEYTSHHKQAEPPQAPPSSEIPKPPIASEPPRNKELPQNNEQDEPEQPAKPPAKTSAKTSAAAEAYFKQMDTNDDGGISLIEFKASPAGKNNPRMAEEYFKNLDVDGDRRLSLAELTTRRSQPKSDFQSTNPPRSSKALESPKLKESGSLKDPSSDENRRKRSD